MNGNEKQLNVSLEIRPELLSSLCTSKTKLWRAAHSDGSDNRVDENAVWEAAGYDTSLGLFAAAFQWLKKRFKNRGKTRQELAAEKEAAKINKTCEALEATLFAYLNAAREGRVDAEATDELTGILSEMGECFDAGKLKLLGERELPEISQSIARFTAALEEEQTAPPLREAETRCSNELFYIREQLIRQKELSKPRL